MVEVTVESIRVSLINQQRLVVLREEGGTRYLPIWIGAFEAEAISMGLQAVEVLRPMTHDLLAAAIEQLGAKVQSICVNDLHDDTFFAQIVLEANGANLDVDCRPSDAIAIAVRAHVPIYVADDVMARAGQVPAEEYEEREPRRDENGDSLDLFRDFIEGLDIDDVER
jgi:bifunctional DNase/RNase